MPNAVEVCLRDQTPKSRSCKAMKLLPMSLLYVAQQLNILKQNNFEKIFTCKEKMLHNSLDLLVIVYDLLIAKLLENALYIYIYIYI